MSGGNQWNYASNEALATVANNQGAQKHNFKKSYCNGPQVV
jgi:hypothetical protein